MTTHINRNSDEQPCTDSLTRRGEAGEQWEVGKRLMSKVSASGLQSTTHGPAPIRNDCRAATLFQQVSGEVGNSIPL